MSFLLKKLKKFCIVILLITSGAGVSARVLGMNGEIFRNGVLYGLPNLDQSSVQFYDGQLRGLTDSNGRQILAPSYADISYCGHGYFLATELNPQHKFYFSDKRHLFNRDGVDLPVTIPDNAVLLNIFSFGRKADLDSNLQLDRLDDETLLLFGFADDRQGLCDIHGKIVLPPVSGEIHYVSTDSAYLMTPVMRYVVDIKSGARTANWCLYNPGVYPPPRLPQVTGIRKYKVPLPEDRKIITIAHDDGLFDREYWLENQQYPIIHIEMFNRFLKQYDLIGMSKTQVISLLGPPSRNWRHASRQLIEDAGLIDSPDILVYMIPTLGCTPSFFALKICVNGDKVEKWYFVSERAESEPVTTNVVLDLSRTSEAGRLFQTRHAGVPQDYPAFVKKLVKPRN